MTHATSTRPHVPFPKDWPQSTASGRKVTPTARQHATVVAQAVHDQAIPAAPSADVVRRVIGSAPHDVVAAVVELVAGMSTEHVVGQAWLPLDLASAGCGGDD